MGVIAEGILRGCQGLFTPVSLRYPLSVFNKISTLKRWRFRKNHESSEWFESKCCEDKEKNVLSSKHVVLSWKLHVVIELGRWPRKVWACHCDKIS